MLINYKQATKEDAQSLKDIAKRVITTNYVSFLGKDTTTTFINSGMSDREIDDALDNCTTMLCDGKIVGFAITKHELLHLIMIDVPLQKRGYGSLLLAYIEEKQFLKFERICLQTFKENRAAVQFYLKNGWLISREERVTEINKTMLHFEKIRHQPK